MDRRGFLRLGAAAGAATLGVAVAGRGDEASAGTSRASSATPPAEAPPVASRVIAPHSDAAGPERTEHLGSRTVVWSVDVAEPLVALTFDDGPDPEHTPRILEALARHDIKATFNVMGHNGAAHPELLEAVAAAGHELGNHTWSHHDLGRTSAAETLEEVRRGAELVSSVTGRPVRWFRPPRGRLSGAALKVAAELHQDVLLWSVNLPPEWRTERDLHDVFDRELVPGSVVALHDGIGRGTFEPDTDFARFLRGRRDLEVRVLPDALERALERGTRFVTASELVAAAVEPDPAT